MTQASSRCDAASRVCATCRSRVGTSTSVSACMASFISASRASSSASSATVPPVDGWPRVHDQVGVGDVPGTRSTSSASRSSAGLVGSRTRAPAAAYSRNRPCRSSTCSRGCASDGMAASSSGSAASRSATYDGSPTSGVVTTRETPSYAACASAGTKPSPTRVDCWLVSSTRLGHTNGGRSSPRNARRCWRKCWPIRLRTPYDDDSPPASSTVIRSTLASSVRPTRGAAKVAGRQTASRIRTSTSRSGAPSGSVHPSSEVTGSTPYGCRPMRSTGSGPAGRRWSTACSRAQSSPASVRPVLSKPIIWVRK